MIEIALFQPQIPQNTGNIGRLAVGFNVPLSLIEPFGFTISDATLKRAGLDYWQYLDYTTFPNYQAFFSAKKRQRIICLSKYGSKNLKDFAFQKTDILLMGNETKGVPEKVTSSYKIERVKIPIIGNIRSYNLANATAIAVYEAHRQLQW